MKAWRPAAALVLLTLLAYANSFRAGLPLDSFVVVRNDSRLQELSWSAVTQIFTNHYWWPTVPSDLYRPLTTLSYWFNYSVLGGGAAPVGYHVFNVGVHALNVLLAWRLFLRLGALPLVAWLAAAIFAVHPLGVESVTNVVGRADLFATAGILLALHAWWQGDAAASVARRRGWRMVATVAALGALLAKETGVMAVAAIGLVEMWRRGPAAGARECLRNSPYLAPPVVAFVVIRVAMRSFALPLPPPFLDNPIAHADWFTGPLTAIGTLGRYLWLFVWPARLSPDYSYPQIRLFGTDAWSTLQPLLALAALGLLTFGLWRGRQRWPWAALGFAWFAVMIFPTSNLVVRIGSVFGERFAYLPMIGLALAGASLAHAVVALRLPARPVLAGVVATALLAGLGARTFARNADWQNDLTLWRSAVQACPLSFKTHKAYASALFALGGEANIDRALAEIQIAVARLENPPLPPERDETTARVELSVFCRAKGVALVARGERPAAQAWFERAVAVLDHGLAFNAWVDAETRRRLVAAGARAEEVGFTGNADVSLQRGLALVELGRLEEAETEARRAQLLAPGHLAGLSILANIDHARGHLESHAIRVLQILLIDPNADQAWTRLSEVYPQLGLPDAIVVQNGQRRLDLSQLRVRAQVNTALLDLVRTFRRARAHAAARAWVEIAVKNYQCDPELFAEKPQP